MNQLNNPYVVSVLAILLGLYASIINPPLPEFLRKLFINPIFRVVFLSMLLVYRFNEVPTIAFTIAFIYVITMKLLNDQEIKENFAYLEGFQNLRKERRTNISNALKY